MFRKPRAPPPVTKIGQEEIERQGAAGFEVLVDTPQRLVILAPATRIT